MGRLRPADEVIAAAVDDWGPRLVAIPAGYAFGAWAGTLVGLLIGSDRDSRADLRDRLGALGGSAGLFIWLLFSFVLD
jgi:hypothetical protein